MAAAPGIRVCHIDLPLSQHPMALPAVRISECASPTAYWATYKVLFESVGRGELPDHDMRFAGRSDQDMQSCMSRVQVKSGEQIQHTFNVVATPTFLIGVVNEDG